MPDPVILNFDYIGKPEESFYLKEKIGRFWKKDHLTTKINEIESFISKMNDDIAENKPVIIFIAVRQGNFPSIEYIAQGLQTDYSILTYGIYLDSFAPENIYKSTLTCDFSLAVFSEIIYRLPPITIYLQAHASWSFLSQLIKVLNPGLKIFQEVYDWMEAFIQNPELFAREGVFSTEEIKLMHQSEHFIKNNINGYLYKDGGEWMEKTVSESSVRSMQILPSPPKKWMKTPITRALDKEICLAYAGQISHKDSSALAFGDIYYMPIVRTLTGQNLKLTLYQSVQHSRCHPKELYKEYYDEAKINPLFEFKKGIPMPAIINALHGNYDFGLMLFRFEKNLAVGEQHLKGTMASKLFTYIASGLPVIISEELEYMADFVHDTGVGIVCSQSDITNLEGILRNSNYTSLINNVHRAQNEYCIDILLPEINDLLNS
jgi:hypothetical protein